MATYMPQRGDIVRFEGRVWVVWETPWLDGVYLIDPDVVVQQAVAARPSQLELVQRPEAAA